MAVKLLGLGGYVLAGAAGLLAVVLPASHVAMLTVGFVAVTGGGLIGLAEGLKP